MVVWNVTVSDLKSTKRFVRVKLAAWRGSLARGCLAVNLCDNNARVSGLSKGGGQCCRDKSAGQGEFLKDMVLFLYDGMAFFFKGY